ncbi:MAG TPA: DUF484 family protein [Gammaproteobacteria bacterium]|nr:DUF484 family protein [Gammaproteobacteria bacterium]
MTTSSSDTETTLPAPETHSSVAEYLRKHRDFFVEHPELLSDLMIPHPTGPAVSLVEKQVELLRDENRELKARFRELVGIARDNEELARRLHRLTLKLVEAESIDQALDVLYRDLRADFAADRVLVQLFASAISGVARAEFVGRGAPQRQAFIDALIERRPQCGRLQKHQYKIVFDADTAEAKGSAAVLPLSGKTWDGVLVIASHDTRRYHPEMGIDLLAHVGDVVSLILQPWIASYASPPAPGD